MDFERRDEDQGGLAPGGQAPLLADDGHHDVVAQPAAQPTAPADHSALLPWMDDVKGEVKHVVDRGKEIADKGVGWGGADSNFTGHVDKKGLDAHEKLGDHDRLNAHVGTDKSGTLGWEHDGKTEGELYGRYKNGSDYEGGIRRNWDLDGGAKLTTGLRQRGTGAGTIDDGYASYRNGGTAVDANAGIGDGHFVGGISGSHQLGANESISGSLSHDIADTTAVSAGYHDGTNNYGAGFTHGAGGDALSMSASQRPSPQLSMSESAGVTRDPQGNVESTLGFSERYRSGQMVHGVDVSAGVGTRNYLSATGSVDAQLARNLYGGAWGTMNMEGGQHTSGQLGASLTMTPSEKTAVTLAGAVNDRGGYEARAELDFLKKGYSGAGDLADRRKDSPVSVYLGYSNGMNHDMMDARYGAGQLQGPRESMISGGVKIKF